MQNFFTLKSDFFLPLAPQPPTPSPPPKIPFFCQQDGPNVKSHPVYGAGTGCWLATARPWRRAPPGWDLTLGPSCWRRMALLSQPPSGVSSWTSGAWKFYSFWKNLRNIILFWETFIERIFILIYFQSKNVWYTKISQNKSVPSGLVHCSLCSLTNNFLV